MLTSTPLPALTHTSGLSACWLWCVLVPANAMDMTRFASLLVLVSVRFKPTLHQRDVRVDCSVHPLAQYSTTVKTATLPSCGIPWFSPSDPAGNSPSTYSTEAVHVLALYRVPAIAISTICEGRDDMSCVYAASLIRGRSRSPDRDCSRPHKSCGCPAGRALCSLRETMRRCGRQAAEVSRDRVASTQARRGRTCWQDWRSVSRPGSAAHPQQTLCSSQRTATVTLASRTVRAASLRESPPPPSHGQPFLLVGVSFLPRVSTYRCHRRGWQTEGRRGECLRTRSRA